jgi:16S rRNA (uracil1498-N3)-methyltransferase
MRRFYHSSSLKLNTKTSLDDFAARHLAQVLRAKVGDRIILFNGDGFDYEAEIKHVDRRDVSVEILNQSANPNESKIRIHLFQALSSNEKMDLVVQKAVELGVQAITPIIASRSQMRLKDEKRDKKLQHWQQIAISACEQSGRAVIPEVYPVSLLTESMNQIDDAALNIMLDPEAKTQLNQLASMDTPSHINVLIGPEGGFSEDEIQLCRSKKVITVNLGPRILRTETAPIATLALLQYLFGDFV